MDKHFNKAVAKSSSLFVNIMFLVIHISFIIFFSYFKINFMVGVNVLSILTYITGFWIIKKNMLKLWVWIMALEVLIHMTLATVCLGTSFGFQYCFIGMVSLFFYAEYFSMKMKNGSINGIFLGIISCVLYFFVEAYQYWGTPAYTIESPLIAFLVRLLMIAVVFLFVIITMKMLVSYSFTVEDGLKKKAEYDELTGLPNRHHMDAMFEEVFRDECSTDYWIAMIDIDDFKHINDTYGHPEGDIVLKKLATILQKYEPAVKVCRWGGEEFLLLGNKKHLIEKYKNILDNIRKAVEEETMELTSTTVNVTVTIGASEYEKGYTLEDWIQIADKKLYVGKYNGKNQVVC